MENMRITGEKTEIAEVFPGTAVPKLSLERDSDLLSRIVGNPNTVINESYIFRLNELAERALFRNQDDTNNGEVLNEKIPSKSPESQIARNDFLKELDAFDH